jgi:hypothetical protein
MAQTCRACGAPIEFVVTKRGQWLPVDLEGPNKGGSHFRSCTDPQRFSKERRRADRLASPKHAPSNDQEGTP